jgi:hypothetical protein
MEQNSSWESNSYSIGQEIPRLLWNPKAHYRVKRARHWTPTWAKLIQLTLSRHISLRSFLTLFFSLCLGLASGSLPSDFLTKTLYALKYGGFQPKFLHCKRTWLHLPLHAKSHLDHGSDGDYEPIFALLLLQKWFCESILTIAIKKLNQ